MESKILEEIKKRRGKPSSVNIYQWLVLLAGAAALAWAIWTSPASVPAVGVIGTTLLLFFVLKDSREKQNKCKKIDFKEMIPGTGENVDLQEMIPGAGKEVDLQETLPRAKENLDLQQMLSEPEETERAEKVL